MFQVSNKGQRERDNRGKIEDLVLAATLFVVKKKKKSSCESEMGRKKLPDAYPKDEEKHKILRVFKTVDRSRRVRRRGRERSREKKRCSQYPKTGGVYLGDMGRKPECEPSIPLTILSEA